MKAYRPILREVDWRPKLTGLGQGAQFENVILQLVEQRGRRTFAEQVNATLAEYTAIAAGVVITVEQVDVVTALLAPRGQQRMSMLVQRLVIQLKGHALLALLAFVLMAQQVFVGDDIGPVMAARVVHAKQYLAEPGKPCQCFQCLGRKGRDTKHDHP
ncbi:hypothetical protein D3C81_1085540 [compost metagenome]